MLQEFDLWNIEKQKINAQKKAPSFKTGEIWWCSIGKNIGREVYGKGNSFTRPVYIFRKVSKDLFLGIPLTSQEKIGTWFHKIQTKDKIRYAVLPQIRLMSAYRLLDHILILPEPDQEAISKSMKEYLFL